MRSDSQMIEYRFTQTIGRDLCLTGDVASFLAADLLTMSFLAVVLMATLVRVTWLRLE